MKSHKQRDQEKRSLIDSHWAYRGRIISLRLDTYQLDHKKKIAEIIHHPGAVVIIPVDEKGESFSSNNGGELPKKL